MLTDGDEIQEDSLPDRLLASKEQVPVLTHDTLSIKRMNRIIEEDLIRKALTKTGGNRTRAAELLEISHRALLYKIKEYKVDL